MKVVNLTPHAINIQTFDGSISIEPSGPVARVSQQLENIGSIDGIRIFRSVLGEVEGLPPPKQDTIYIVSQMVSANVHGRTDIYSPGELIRDDSGRVIGCKGLIAP